MGLCGCDGDNNGVVHMVYCTDHSLAVCCPCAPSLSDPNLSRRTKFRKDANAADNKGATVAVDSLINFEAVKVDDTMCLRFSH